MECSTVALVFLRVLVVVYTFITWPFYYIFQQAWKAQEKLRKPRGSIVSQNDESVTVRSTRECSDVHARLHQENVDTLEKALRFAVRQHGQRRALGTRQILGEEDEIQPNGRVFKKFALGDYQWRTFTQLESEAESFGRGLRELGLRSKEKVVIFGETRAEWLISAFGAMKQNITLVTLYATLGEDALIHGINETEVTCVVTTHELAPKFKNILSATPRVSLLIIIEEQLKPLTVTGFRDSVKVLPYREVLHLGQQSSLTGTPPTANDIAIVMYTSGSTGTPKGVLMSHNNVLSALLAFTNIGEVYEDDIYIAFLPLAHVLELIAECMCMLYGVPIGYSSPLTMTDNSSKIKLGCQGDATLLRPTLMAAVPLILERIYKSIQEKVDSSSLFKKALFKMAMDYKIHWHARGYGTPLIDKFMFKPIKNMMGGRVRYIIAGGAPLAEDTHAYVRAALCTPILQGYGLTETCSASVLMDPYDRSTGTVGGPLTCCDVRLVNWEEGGYRVTDIPNPRGEIHIGGDNVVLGYFKQAEKTDEDFYEENGQKWFRTGDIGELCPGGFFKIIDRKKDLVKLQFGEYVSLGKVESEFKTCPLVDNICVYADSTKSFPVALIVPNLTALKELAAKIGKQLNSIEEFCADTEVQKAAATEIQNFAKKSRLQKFEIPQGVRLVPEVWTPDLGLVTAALKLKRKNIQDRYQPLIDSMYS